MTIVEDLAGIPKEKYGREYHDHVLDIYKLYVEMADKVSERRQSANSFFLSINSAIIAFVGSVDVIADQIFHPSLFWLIGFAGMVLSYQWYRLVRSYKDLNTGKFKVIHEIERHLPFRPYDAEWTALGRGERADLYLPFTHVEIRVPWVFFAIHLFILVINLPWSLILAWF